MRKLFSVLSSTLQGGVRRGLLLLLLVASVSAIYASDTQVGGIWYDFDSSTKTASVTYRGSSYSSYEGEYSGSVTIPETVTYNGTTYSVTSIGEDAFDYCSSLTSVTIPNSVTSIGDWAFNGCSSLTSVTIPNSIKSIGYYTFRKCTSLTSVTIPYSVTSIGEEAFYSCSSLTSVTINSNAIVSKDYSNYSNISDIFGSQVTEFIIGDDVNGIGSYAFYGCSSLTSVTILNSVTSIGDRAFQSCSSLTSVSIGKSVRSIARSAFRNCALLSTIVVDKNNTKYDSREECNAIIETTTNTLILGCQNTTIPNSVTSIGYSAFEGCSSLTSVTIPNSVTSIGYSAFEGCSSLTSVTIPNSVTSIGYSAFYYCSSLTSVTIPNSVTSIESSVFEGCSSLTSVTIGNSVTSIGQSAFEDCSSLTSVTIPNSVTSIGTYAFYYCSSLTSVTIPNSIKSIGYYTFMKCTSLTSVTIPNSVTSIESYAFEGCSSLTSVTIGNSVTSIGNYAFEGCSSLTSVTIPNSVTSIESSVFEGCSSLTSVTIPNSVTSIGSYAFNGCSSLTSVTIPNSVTSIGVRAFYNCSKLTKTNYTGDIAGWCNIMFGSYYANPMYCSHNFYINDQEIKDLVIPNNVTSIGSHAFNGCSSLTSVTIPNSVTSIESYAFEGCSSLTSVTCEAETPPTVGKYTFDGVSISIPVYVPCGCVEAYKAASGWSDFTNIQVPLLEYSIKVYVNDTIMGTANVDYNTFCEGNQISAKPNFGYHFVQWSDGNTDAIRTLELTQDTILTAEFAQSFSGQCGDDLYWNYDETTKTISITGSGKMYDYTATTQPWLLFKDQILEVTTSNTVTSIGTSAFEGCIRLSKISLGTGLEEIATNAFAGCTRLYDIYVYATYPPFADDSSFANYNVYVYIPCEYQRNYILDVVWGNFKFIECLESEETTTDGNVTVVPGTNDVTITWPAEDNADNYTIVIEKDGEVFCTLTFNAEGQLLNIAFAPGRDGNHPAQYAEQAGNGYRFTVTGLTEATRYAYSVTTKDAANQTIATYSGEFTTKGGVATSIEEILHSTTNCQKIIRNGQLIIIRDGVEYNAVGQEIGN